MNVPDLTAPFSSNSRSKSRRNITHICSSKTGIDEPYLLYSHDTSYWPLHILVSKIYNMTMIQVENDLLQTPISFFLNGGKDEKTLI